MNECITCGRMYATVLEAQHCSDFENHDLDDRLVEAVVQAID